MTDNFVTSGFFCAAADGFVGSSVSGHIHTDIEIFPVDQYCRPTECIGYLSNALLTFINPISAYILITFV